VGARYGEEDVGVLLERVEALLVKSRALGDEHRAVLDALDELTRELVRRADQLERTH
jgi:hypothetical protein